MSSTIIKLNGFNFKPIKLEMIINLKIETSIEVSHDFHEDFVADEHNR